ncbi:MAG: tetraacyldisaccharide 4'-kinase [Chitinispirillia bacterium]|nr:tetraacyldisaccharide 4'-kinase [Chitinispirillia bacterium]MCL2268812.1 tetraacyldisaccharide 4'-kinase [Chitinispirillia bacterium]
MEKHQHKKPPFDSPLPGRLGSNPAVALLSHAYAAAVSTRNFAYNFISPLSQKLPRPVISIGGIRAGGTGKTPAAQFVGRHIVNNCGYGVAFLSRGYGRMSKRPVIVPPHEAVDWREVGDEPWMLHSNIPESWLGINPDRAAVAQKLSPRLPEKTVFILDDGFQHRRIRRDLDIVCISEGTFSDRMMPAGYLREPYAALSRAGIVLVVGAEERLDRLREAAEAVERRFGAVYAELGVTAGSREDNGACGVVKKDNPDDDTNAAASVSTLKKPPICAVLLQYPHIWVEARSGKTSAGPPLRNPVAVTGIARPERFLAMLNSLSVIPSEVRVFRDHHNFKRKDFAFEHNIYLERIVTTEKDAVRLLSPEFADIREVWYLKTGLRFADPEAGEAVLSRINGICR